MDDGKEIAIAMATEVAKQVPVKAAYDDTVSPAAKQVGKFAEELAKAIRLVLFPVQVLAAGQDRFEGLLNRSIRGIPAEDLVAPAPQILGASFEAIRYEPEGSPIDEMFEALLNKSMSAPKLRYAHPAFPIIIRQLSPDEAKILHRINASWMNGSYPKQQFTMQLDASRNPMGWKDLDWERDELDRHALDFSDNLDFYLRHLYAMGLYEAFKLEEHRLPLDMAKPQTGTRILQEIRLTDFGQQFMLAVTR